MNFGRRDFLKYFGVGAVVAPVVNGLTDESTRARIIEPPKVELVEAPKIIEAKDIVAGEYDAVIYLTPRNGVGKAFRWDVNVATHNMQPLSLKCEQSIFTISDKRGRRFQRRDDSVLGCLRVDWKDIASARSVNSMPRGLK